MITVEKEVYEAVLRNSVRVNDLEAENQQLKELLKECRPYVDQAMPISFNDNDIGWKPWQINRCTILTKIDNAIGEKK